MFYLHVVYMGKGEDGRSAHVGGTLPDWFKLHALYMREAEEASRHARGTKRTISERGYFSCAINCKMLYMRRNRGHAAGVATMQLMIRRRAENT